MEIQTLPLPEWPNYRVGIDGRIYGARGQPLAGYLDKDGYHCVLLYKNNQRKAMKSHRAVVIAFLGPIPAGMVVNHKNGAKADNRLENLEVVSCAENTKHGFKALGRVGKNSNPNRGSKHHNSRFTDEAIRDIRRLFASGMTQTAIAAIFETGQNHISRIVRRESWGHVSD